MMSSRSLATGIAAHCFSCSEPIPLSAKPLICALCFKPSCGKCHSREPADRESLFRAPIVICANCSDRAAATMDQQQEQEQQQQQQQLQQCRGHPDRFLNLFCWTCQAQMCSDGISPEHERHVIVSVKEALGQKLPKTVQNYREITRRLEQVAIRQVEEDFKVLQEVERWATIIWSETAKERNRPIQSLLRSATQKVASIAAMNANHFLRSEAALNEQCATILANVDQLQVDPVRWNGWNECRDLSMRIGIPGPGSSREESLLVSKLLAEQRELNAQLKKENAALTEQLKVFQFQQQVQPRPQTPITISPIRPESVRSTNPFAIGSLKIWRRSKDSEFCSQPVTTSHDGVSVYIIIVPNFAILNTQVDARVCWTKGPKMRFQIFIEVVGDDNLRLRDDRMFDCSAGTSFIWPAIISHDFLFRTREFLHDDHLKINFGVRPVVE